MGGIDRNVYDMCACLCVCSVFSSALLEGNTVGNEWY